MRDIFDILENRKDIHINIKGEVLSCGLLFSVEYIDELTSLLLDNQQEVVFNTFNVKESRDSGTFVSLSSEAVDRSISFHIDVYITNKLYRKIDEAMQDFIDYYTVGAIKCHNVTNIGSIVVDNNYYEEFRSAVRPNPDIYVSPLDFWEEYNDWDMGSYPRFNINHDYPRLNINHDADGDRVEVQLPSWDAPNNELILDGESRPVVFGGELSINSIDATPTNMSNMFSNCSNLSDDIISEILQNIERNVFNGMPFSWRGEER